MNKKSLPDILLIKRFRRKHFFRAMKITTLLLFMFIFCLHAENSNSQNVSVTIHKNDVRLENVLNEIEKQTDYLFVYNKNVDVDRNVSVFFSKLDLQEALKNIFGGLNIQYEIDGRYVLLSSNKKGDRRIESLQQSGKKRILGTVVNKNGEPIIGANVIEKGSTNGIITGIDGKFVLSVDPTSTLQISYIGYQTKEVGVYGSSSLIVELQEDMELLDEVVVVGYAVQKKANLSGSVATLDTKKLEDRPVSNIGQALQGAVASLNVDPTSGDPNELPSFNIRGFASINGGSPLVVIDGVISDANQLNTLNPADIANVSVLKDAASAAIYGSRAAYGVILVTTKTGKTERVTVNYNNNFSVRFLTEKPNIFLNSYHFYNDWNIGAGAQVFANELLDVAKAYMKDRSNPDGLWMPTMGQQFYVLANNPYDVFYKKSAFSTNHTIDISGKTEKLNYYISGGYTYQDGMIRFGDFDYNKYNIRAKLDIQLTPWWKIGSNSSFVSSLNRSSSAYLIYADPDNYRLSTQLGVSVAPVQTSDGHWYDLNSSYGDFEEGGQAKKYDDTFSQLFTTKIDLLKDVLTLNGQFNYSIQRVKTDFSTLSYDVYVAPGIFDSKRNTPNSMTNRYGTVRHMTYDAYANFDKTFAEKHALSAVLGFNQEDYRYVQQNMKKTQLVSQNLPSVQLAYGMPTVGENIETWALRGAYGRLNYIFDNKYIFEFNGRYDGTSRFPHDDRFVFNPSGSVAWVLSEEKFFQPLRTIFDRVKIRGSYGQLGNQDVNAYAYMATMAVAQSDLILGGKLPMYVSAPELVSNNLTWEKVTTADIGVDLTLFDNRLNFTGDIYRRNTKDMLTLGEVLPGVLGANLPKENSADLKTTGFDLTVSWRDQIKLAGKPLEYSLEFNLSDSKSEITEFSNPTGTLNSYYKGQKIGEIWGLTSDGLYKSDEEAQKGPDQTEILIAPSQYPTVAGSLKYKDLNNDGKITRGKYTLDDHGDLTVIGNDQIRYRFGATFAANWSGFDISAFFQGVMKHNYYPTASDKIFWGKYSAPWFDQLEGHYFDRWKEDNPNLDAYWPVLSHRNASTADREMNIPQTRYLQNAAYIRLKNLTLGYTLPGKWVSKLSIQRMRIFYSGDNLFCLSGLYSDYSVDPENLGANRYPFQRYNSFGINVTF